MEKYLMCLREIEPDEIIPEYLEEFDEIKVKYFFDQDIKYILRYIKTYLFSGVDKSFHSLMLLSFFNFNKAIQIIEFLCKTEMDISKLDYLEKLLKRVELNVKKEDVPEESWERSLVENFLKIQEEFKKESTLDILGLYNILDCFERSNNISSRYVQLLTYIFLLKNKFFLIDLIDKEKMILKLYNIIIKMDEKSRLEIALKTKNKYFRIETLRFAENIEYINDYSKIFLELYSETEESQIILKALLNFKNRIIFRIIGEVINLLKIEDIESLILKIELKFYDDILEEDYFNLLSKLENINYKKKILEIYLEKVDNKESLEKGKDNLQKLMIYYLNSLTENEKEEKIIKIISSLKELDNYWYISKIGKIFNYFNNINKLEIFREYIERNEKYLKIIEEIENKNRYLVR